MNTNALFTLTFILLSFAIHAQDDSNQKSHTYEEAVKLLTAGDDEFTIKGELPELPSVGQQLHEARIRHDISLSTLSFVAGLSEEVLTKIEEDRITPTRDIISKIEDFLGEEIILIDN